ncbi:hypothetical protein ONS95_008993 [Cadophora gregata]|uniref:uncharacterized protein n=1 Tax=Cadophora gregata TaxID=51156 RepID=UPI0026DAB3FD|nr:uncharacterized protein ONS95_008993 [Cadophora gregata]KAK0124004.1 hypothetical protein ONS95_008993 [Cadophora gregata]KAK0130342.1 hypothetical protein ONS96_000864 [Cadophora gregata f. sp. sojae]
MATENFGEYVIARGIPRQRHNEPVPLRGELVYSMSMFRSNEESRPIGARFEGQRRKAIFHLKKFIRYQEPIRAKQYLDKDHEPGAMINANDADTENIHFEVARDLLRVDLRFMLSLLDRILEAESSYKAFPYVPRCLLYVCGFGLAQEFARTPEGGFGVPMSTGNTYMGLKSLATATQRWVLSYQLRFSDFASVLLWHATGNAAVFSARISVIRAILLFGFGASCIWTVYQSLKFGIIVSCKHSVKRLRMAVGRNHLEEDEQNLLSGWKWELLSFIHMMH